MKLPKILEPLCKELKKRHAKAILVGGSVRDHFLKLPSKDYDIEVYGLKMIEELENILSVYGSVNLVGKSFGVLKFSYEGEEYDFSFPRKERKIAKGHTGFEVNVDSSMDFKEASKRRDFTINAFGYDIDTQTFLDPFGGQDDIQNRCLRHIDDKTFIEDPLRVYRAVQFCARFEYVMASSTFDLCQKMVQDGLLEELPKERLYTEFTKLLLKAKKPSIGFELLLDLGILKRYFVELYAIVNVPQSSKWHPEGDVWVHTMMCIDEMALLLRDDGLKSKSEKEKLRFMFAILCHDLGKATATTIDDKGQIRSISHEYEGIEPTKTFLSKLTNEQDFIDTILPLVEHHLKPSQFYKTNAKDKAVRKLATKVNIEELVVVAEADFLGRTTLESLEGVYHASEWLLDKAKNLKVENRPLDNLLQGRDLIVLGFEPSPKFKMILDEIYDMMIEGELRTKEEALEWVKTAYFKETL